MASLSGVSVASSYTSLLKLDGNTDSTAAGNGSNAIQVKTGDNEATPLFLNTDRLGIGGQPTQPLDVTGNAKISGSVAIGANVGSFKLEVSGGDIGFFKSVSAGSGINNLLTIGATDGGVNMGGGEGAGILFKIPDDETNPSIGAQIGAIKESADDSVSSTALVFSTSQNDETLDEAMRIDSSGNVGIGTGSDTIDAPLHVKGGTANTAKFQSASGATNILLSDSSDSLVGQIEFSASASQIVTRTSSTLSLGSNNVQTLHITDDDNVGIGTSSPEERIHSTGAIVSTGVNDTGATAGTERAFIDLVSNKARIGHFRGTTSAGSGGLQLYTDSVERMRIDASGNVGIGASPQTALSPNLTIEGASPALILRDSNSLANNFYTIYSANGDIEHYFDHEKSVSFATTTDYFGSNESTKLKIDGATGNSDFQNNYIVNEQGRQNHVANTMSSPYYRFDGVDDKIEDSDFGGANFSSPSGSISLWVMSHDRDNPSIQGVVTNGSTGSGRHDLTINNNRFEYSVHNGSTVSQLYHSGTITENVWYHVVVTREYDGTDTLLKMYINGVLDASSTVSSFVQDSSVNPLIIGYLNSSRYFNGQIACVRVWNHILSATDVKDDYSGASVPFKYKGANQTDLVTSNFVNNGSFPFDTFTGASANGFTAVRSTSGTKVAGTADEIVLVKGKSYRVSFDVTLTSGTFPLTRVRESQTSGTLIEIVSTGGASDGDKINFEFTATASGTYVVSFESSNVVSFAIANFNFVQIGAVAEYDGSGIASDEWFDKSGNDLHGTVSGATVENAPSDDDGLVYEEGTFTVDNNSDSTGTISAQIGEYVRIGNMVHVRACVTVSANFASNTFSGLPYVCNNSASPSSLIGGFGVLTGADGEHQNITASAGATSTNINLFDGNNAGDTHTPTTGHGTYRIFLSYMT